MNTSAGAWAIASFAVSAFVSLDILFFKHRPVSAVLWLGVVWSFAWWGPLAYAVLGIDSVRRPGLGRFTAQGEPRTDGAGSNAFVAIDRPVARAAEAAAVPGSHVLRVTEPAVPQYRVSSGNRADLLVDGGEFYSRLLDSIAAAESSIHIASYIISRHSSSAEILSAMAGRAREGVRVRLLYDRFGSAFAHYSGFFRKARAAGVEARPHRTWGQVNLRHHRKLAVIDGRTAFVGGMNLDDRNVPGAEEADRDYQVVLQGPIVGDLQTQFLEDWVRATRRRIGGEELSASFPPLSEVGTARAQAVPGGPDPAGDALSTAYFGAVASATSRLSIVTPYFLPDDAIFEALRFAALRGVEVRVVLPEKSNHWYTAYAARALYGPLLAAGVRIFERRAPFMHAKALVVDGVYAMMGSANLDYRSLHLNFELNVEIADQAFAERLERQIDLEMTASREVTREAYQRRPVAHRLTENVCRLFQPVL